MEHKCTANYEKERSMKTTTLYEENDNNNNNKIVTVVNRSDYIILIESKITNNLY